MVGLLTIVPSETKLIVDTLITIQLSTQWQLWTLTQ